ncbi:MAG TPA: HEPN domain-containing protein [Longimicrobium sp.]|jgi:hypothetical protein
MIAADDLKHLARGRLRDAKALFRAGRYDAAAYICGYAVEAALKARICRTLRWTGFPDTNKEFEHYHSLKTHRLDVLLELSGQSPRITGRYGLHWDAVVKWDPVQRYRPIGSTSRAFAEKMLRSTQVLVRVL